MGVGGGGTTCAAATRAGSSLRASGIAGWVFVVVAVIVVLVFVKTRELLES